MTFKYPCSICLKAVRNNQKSILCAKCKLWTHANCCNVSMEIFNSNVDWFCTKCLFDELPMLELFSDGNSSENSVTEPRGIHNLLGNSFCQYNSFDSSCEILKRNPGLNIMHLNICSLYRCIDEIRTFFEQSQYDVLSFSETMLDETIPDACISINNYAMVRKDRNRNGGGIIVYVKKNIIFNVREEFADNELEMLVLEIEREKQKPLLICVWYRPPNSKPSLFDNVNDAFDKFESMDLDIILLGDLNCDVSSKNPNIHTKRLIELAENYRLTQLIDKPTRVTQASSTTIDLIFTSDSNKVNFSDVVQVGLSDHYMVVLSWGRTKRNKSDHKYVISRAVNKMDVDNFKKDLSNQTWADVLTENDAVKAYKKWMSTFRSIIDKYAPLKKRRVRQKNVPWITNEVKVQMRERDKCKKRAVSSGKSKDWNQYKILKNKVTSTMRRLKKDYVQNSIAANSGNSGEMWKSLRSIVPNKCCDSDIPTLKVDDQVINDPGKLAKSFNDYFAGIVRDLKSVHSFKGNFRKFIKKRTNNMFNFTQVSENDVTDIINNIPSNKATGLDGISARIVKMAAPYISLPLTHIINLSLCTGSIPQDWKCAKIVPVFKKGCRTERANYRPISVLPVLSKVIERIVHKQTMDYLCRNLLLFSKQSGFRKSHSTTTALLNLTEDLLNGMDKGLVTGFVALDLKRAFDTVDHGILIEKLRMYGFNEASVLWFMNYLRGRTQCTCVNGSLSPLSEVEFGVPQGSILGPMLFLLFINDISESVKHCQLSLYANDTCLYVSSLDPYHIEKCINQDLKTIASWLSANNLILNASKTEYIMIGSRKKLKDFHDCGVKFHINGNYLNEVYHCKYLGVVLDPNLTWNLHVEHIRCKVIKNMFLFRKARPFIDQNVAKTLYYTIIQSHLDYCSPVWSNAANNVLKKLHVLQKRALRIVLKSDFSTRSSDLYHMTYVDPIDLRWKKTNVLLLFKAMHLQNMPSYLSSRIQMKSNPYMLRNSISQILLPKPKTGFLKRSFTYTSSKIFNSLPLETRQICDINNFTRSIKKDLTE